MTPHLLPVRPATLALMLLPSMAAECQPAPVDTPPDCDPEHPEVGPDADGDGWADCADCAPEDPAIHPGAAEICDDAGIDEDCDGSADLDDPDTVTDGLFMDGDGDGWGHLPPVSCDELTRSVPRDGDCDDTDASVNPGAEEICDDLGVDEDCDGLADLADPDAWDPGVPLYADDDGDGYGGDEVTPATCAELDTLVSDGGDCDDTTALASPGNPEEICRDGLDNNCDGSVEPCTYGHRVDLDDADLAVLGPAGEGVGQALGFAGDVDGDGRPDLFVGAPAGEAVYRVGIAVEPELGPDIDLADATALRRLTGGGEAGFGSSLSVAANPDGVADLVIGAPRLDHPVLPRTSGAVYHLAADADARTLEAPADGWTGERFFDGTGTTVATRITADGALETWIAVPEHNRIYRVTGRPDAPTSLADADAIVDGGDREGATGTAIAPVGDVDGDGEPDLLIGAPLADAGLREAGRVYLVTAPPSGTVTLADLGESWIGSHSGAHAGAAVSGAGDVDGDGYDDVIIGAPDHPSGGTFTGAAHLVHGPLDGSGDLGLSDAVFWGQRSGDRFGADVAGGSDIGGDGELDLLIGAPGHDRGGSGTGAAYLFQGPFDGLSEAGEDATAFTGAAADDRAGSTVLLPGDLDEDGLGELLIGAPGADGGAGAAYLMLGLGG